MATQLLRREAVQKKIGLGRNFIYAMMAKDQFPRPIKLGQRAVAWREEDIEAWIASREAA